MAARAFNMFAALPEDAANDVVSTPTIKWHPQVDTYDLPFVCAYYISKCDKKHQRYLRQMCINFHPRRATDKVELDHVACEAFLALVPRRLRDYVRADFNDMTYNRMLATGQVKDIVDVDDSDDDSWAAEECYYQMDLESERRWRLEQAGKSYV